MTIHEKFNSFNEKEVSRKEILDLINEAKEENNTEIVYRLSKILLDNPKVDVFEVSLKTYKSQLNAPSHSGKYKEALTDSGRLKKGWKFQNGRVFKVIESKKRLSSRKISEGLKVNGRLKKGYKYEKGKVIKVVSKKKVKL